MNHYMNRIFLLLGMALAPAVCLRAETDPSPAPTGSLQIGIGGHTFTQAAYNDIPADNQLELLKELNVRVYRFDIGSNTLFLGKWIDFAHELKKNNIEPLALLVPPGKRNPKADLNEVESSAREYAFNVARKMKDCVQYWDIDNELDGWAILHKGDMMADGNIYNFNPPAGDQKDNYEDARYQFAMHRIKGLIAGVRAADPNAKVMVNSAGWHHFGFIDRLVQDGVAFDILGWHWYSEMGNLDEAKYRKNLVVMDRLLSYGKPLWITENNYRPGGAPEQEVRQAEYFANTVERMKKLFPKVRVYCVYELLDEPYFGATTPYGNYGLVKVRKSDDGKWVLDRKKPAFDIIKAATKPSAN